MIHSIEAAWLLEDYGARLDRGGHELWHGVWNPAGRDVAAFRELAAQFRQLAQGTKFHPKHIALLERHAAALRRINEPLRRREVAEATRQEAIVAVGIAAQLERVSTWIGKMMEE